jgi:hypothetical protein
MDCRLILISFGKNEHSNTPFERLIAVKMPPTPSSRRSPKENIHKRGHSFESILPAKPKDDELLLFTDMQKHERDTSYWKQQRILMNQYVMAVISPFYLCIISPFGCNIVLFSFLYLCCDLIDTNSKFLVF